jgi:hypothetical protein
MEKWKKPTIEELNVSCTEHGDHICTEFDEVRVDQNGNYWAGFQSGGTSNPPVNGEVEIPEKP